MYFQIETMLSLGYKAEIQALSSISFDFLTDTYLPVKIKHGRWIWREKHFPGQTRLLIYILYKSRLLFPIASDINFGPKQVWRKAKFCVDTPANQIPLIDRSVWKGSEENEGFFSWTPASSFSLSQNES